jgi:hypothetical protein
MSDLSEVGIAAGAAVAVLLVYHFAFVAPRLRAFDTFLRTPSTEATPAFVKRTEDRLLELESSAKVYALRVGFLRYSSFADAGLDLSYSLALLNSDGDGVVITSIYSREESRTFGKRVRGFAADQELSKEEQDAIAQARAGLGS